MAGLLMALDKGRQLPRFSTVLRDHGVERLIRDTVTTLQINVGKRCNMACHHCHVEAGPRRTEVMSAEVASRVLELLEKSPSVRTLDLTGGAPELCPEFRRLVRGARRLGLEVIDRCNLTVLHEPGMEDLPELFASECVHVVASLPCYLEDNVDRQRGRGAFDGSVAALRRLNALGYGREGSPLKLDLVYNPVGAHLPPPQAALEVAYRAELERRFGIRFHHLLTLTNMPIRRFAHSLEHEGRTESYMSLLVNHFNPATVPGLMCRSLVSVGWDGQLYDCDFNQMLDMPLGAGPRTIFELESLRGFAGRPIATADHCFGCTAGSGSSCTGAIA